MTDTTTYRGYWSQLNTPISTDLGSELGEPGSAATPVAPAPDGASAHASDEPVASGRSERRATVQEEAVERARTRTTRSLSPSPLGKPATGGSAGVTGSTEPDPCRTDASDRARSGEVPASAALNDPSRGGCTDGISLRADYRESRAISVRQTSGVIFGIGALGGLERRQASAGTYHQAGQFSAALLVSGSGAGYQPYDSRMAQ